MDNSLNETMRQIAYLQAGGDRPKTTADSMMEAFGTLQKGALDVATIRKAQADTIKTVLEQKKTALETEKLRQGNLPAADAFAPQIQQGPALEANQSMRDAEISQANAKRDELRQKFGNWTVDQAKDMAAAEHSLNPDTKTDLLPLSKVMAFQDAKQVVPTLTAEQYARTTYGGLKQYVASNKQADLNTNRGNMRDAQRDSMVLQLREKIDQNPFLNKLREQGLGLDVTDDIGALVSAGNTVAASALGLKEAKGLGEAGVMTNQDVVRYTTSGQLTQHAADVAMKWLVGRPTDATLQDIAQINNVIKTRLSEKLSQVYGNYADLLAHNFDITREDAAKRLAITIPATQSSGASGAGGGLQGFDPKAGIWSDPEKQKRYEAYKASQQGGR